ncbi:LPXTG cell wall anchor domain-containing protein [Cytobacillus solani]|uniref:Gram-positive cocci surface proteins LPxTG domain-containing protein n=1 Tax=Cytobacillus solani TaxID=1637975 RepID=A0A0Q3VFM9_9BACI|nr:LPXTG cell wall anchor domain-containing protein [Cytobacillus solani]KOP71068.1 hypothetical protein AMS60_23735 [Bacillus sp. FJAT-21945]KQL17986.1 hypothetical protein AN957_04755 [Cytobacillus solani]USK55813.1 LPXTG cell wall anchor domain-containing protein [Cytobacillus solani]
MNKRFILAKPKIIAFIAGIFIFMLVGETSARAANKEIDIHTKMNPSGYFFEVGNLKPGDWMPRDIVISNAGTQDFKYMAILGKKKSVKGLLKELDLIVKKNEEVLYDGKMDQFTGFTPRNLAKSESETLFFQVTMPNDLGNAFQSSGAEVEILFVAEALGDTGGGDPGGENPGEEPVVENSGEEPDDEVIETNNPTGTIIVSPEIRENLLPKTATNTYNSLLIGSVLFVAGSIFYKRKFRIINNLE